MVLALKKTERRAGMDASIPKVFISYSWDSEEHKKWVRNLAERLVANGVEVTLDQWHLTPGQSLTQFMEAAIAESDYVVVVCTANYSARSIARIGGVGYEQQIISGRIFAGLPREKFIPLVRQGEFQPGAECAIPPMFSGTFALDMRNPEREDASLETLLRAIYRKPLYKQPRRGAPPQWLDSTSESTRGADMAAVRLATMDLDGWELVSGLAQHHRTPESFYMPSERDRRTLDDGKLVKLMFDIDLPDGWGGDKKPSSLIERMWVIVTGRVGPYYVGELNNHPATSSDQDHLRAGDEVVFLPEHVIDILEEESPKGIDGHRAVRLSWDRDSGETEEAAQGLIHPNRLWSCAEVLDRECLLPRTPGVYAWYFDQLPPTVPGEPCHTFEGRYLLYVGISPKPPPKNGAAPSTQTVIKRLRYHYRGNAAGSTLRQTLGCLLAAEIGVELRRVGSGNRMTFGSGEARLSEWMAEHTRVACVRHEEPWNLEHHLIDNYSLPLNLDQNRLHAFHSVLSKLRREAKDRARTLPVL